MHVRTCTNGVLDGTGTFGSCVVDQPLACQFNGMTVPSGQSVTAYLTSTVPAGSICQPQTRVCTNGVLSSAGEFATCSPATPAACLVNGQTVASGSSIVLFKTAVAASGSCETETRVCTNGALSGTATFLACDNSPLLSPPPYTQFRTDFDSASKGMINDPVTIDPCQLQPIVGWQADLCANINRATRGHFYSNSYNVNKNFSRFWVLHVNDEPAFEADNSGPPGQSLPVNGGVVGVVPLSNGVQLELSNLALNGASTPGGIPFIGYGLQMGRGAGNSPLLPNANYIFSFDVTLNSIATSLLSSQGVISIHFFVETQAAGKRKFSWVFLGRKNSGYVGSMVWNWPIRESMWYPGAVIDGDNGANISSRCNIAVPEVQMSANGLGKTVHYDIDLAKYISCVSGLAADTPITGIHFALEESAYQANYIKASFTNISTRPK